MLSPMTAETLSEIMSNAVWPLAGVLVVLFIFRQFREDIDPIMKNMITTLAGQAPRYAIIWSFALLTATLASLQALQEVAQQMHWVYIGALAKIMQPGLAVLVAYGRPAPAPAAPNGQTQPPFPQPESK